MVFAAVLVAAFGAMHSIVLDTQRAQRVEIEAAADWRASIEVRVSKLERVAVQISEDDLLWYEWAISDTPAPEPQTGGKIRGDYHRSRR